MFVVAAEEADGDASVSDEHSKLTGWPRKTDHGQSNRAINCSSCSKCTSNHTAIVLVIVS